MGIFRSIIDKTVWVLLEIFGPAERSVGQSRRLNGLACFDMVELHRVDNHPAKADEH